MSQEVFAGAPEGAAPSFVVVLHDRWWDVGAVSGEERAGRAEEY